MRQPRRFWRRWCAWPGCAGRSKKVSKPRKARLGWITMRSAVGRGESPHHVGHVGVSVFDCRAGRNGHRGGTPKKGGRERGRPVWLASKRTVGSGPPKRSRNPTAVLAAGGGARGEGDE